MVFLFLMLLFMTVSCILMDARSSLEGGWNTSNMGAYINTFTVFPALAVFAFVKKISMMHPCSAKTAKLLSVLSSCTFGMYLFMGIFRRETMFVYDALRPKTGAYAADWIHTLVIVLAGMVCVLIWKCLTGFLKGLAGKLTGRGREAASS